MANFSNLQVQQLSFGEMTNVLGGAAQRNSIGLDNKLVTIMMQKYAGVKSNTQFTMTANGESYTVCADVNAKTLCFVNAAGKSFKVRM